MAVKKTDAKTGAKKPAAKKTAAKKAAAKKTAAKKTAAKKPAAKKTAAKKATVKKSPAKKAATKKTAPRKIIKSISAEDFYKFVQEAAYFMAERDGFSADTLYYWCVAEEETRKRLGM